MVTTVTDNSPQSINTSLFSLDKEVQEVKKTTDALNDKLSGINTESGVISVNGKQGIVELNASDVDALPSSTVIPTTTSELENNSGFITSSGNITGNAATATTADKVKNALTVNGKTYDGSSAVDAGVQTIANGGTGQTTQEGINKAFVGALEEGTSDVTDGTMFVSSWASDNGFADTNAVNVPYKRKFSRVWEYIKGKISSVLGITNNKHIIRGQTVDTNTYADTNPKLVFSNVDGSQNASLTFTDYDKVQAPASITLNGNQGGEYFIAPNIKATDKFYGNLSGKADTAETADKAIQDGNGNVITSTYAKKGEVGVPQVVHFSTSNSAGSYELVHFDFRSAFRCVISGTCGNYAEAKIIDVIASNAGVPQSNTLGNTAIGPQGNFSFGGGDSWVSSHMYWNKPLTEENVYYTVVLIPYSESNIDLVI